MNIIVLLIIAVSLSMDAFSLSLAYGTLGLNKKSMLLLSSIVGVYHFFMPLLGMLFGGAILKYFPIKIDLIVFIVLCFIGIQMILETFNGKENVKLMSLPELFLFGLAVSLDSFSVGIGLRGITNSYFLSFIIFSICSLIFTYFGLLIGKKVNKILGKISTLIGGVILIIIGLIYLF